MTQPAVTQPIPCSAQREDQQPDLEVDTGASASIVSEATYRKRGLKINLKSSTVTMLTYT